MVNQRIAVVTGSCSGIGLELSRALLAGGYSLATINRNKTKADSSVNMLLREFPGARIDSYIADLSVHQEIRDVVAEISAGYKAIDLLFNNAGVLLGTKQLSRQGNEMHFEVNTVAPFLLTRLLKPLLMKGRNAAVVTSGSGARKLVKALDLKALRNPVVFRKMTGPYAHSKLAISMAFSAMGPEFGRANVRLSVVDLGPVKTDMSLGDGMPGWMRLLRPLFATPQRAARRLIDAALIGPSVADSDSFGSKVSRDTRVQEQLVALLSKITQPDTPADA